MVGTVLRIKRQRLLRHVHGVVPEFKLKVKRHSRLYHRASLGARAIARFKTWIAWSALPALSNTDGSTSAPAIGPAANKKRAANRNKDLNARPPLYPCHCAKAAR